MVKGPLAHARSKFSFAVLLATTAAVAPTDSWAEDTCNMLSGETIRWIVPYSAGGGYDTYSRLIEPVLERHLGAEIAVVNMPGAGGMVGAKSIASQAPDGKTIGLINASGLLVAKLGGQDDIPSVADDFTALGRVARDVSVWLKNAETDIRVNETGGLEGGKDPYLFGVTGIGSGDWFTITIGTDLMGLSTEFVAGYDGSKEALLGLVRGEFDLMDISWGSALAPIENGEVTPVLQFNNAPVADHPSLEGVPLLGGPNGVARAHAAASGEDPDRIGRLADGLVEVMGAGRLVVAPAGIPEPVRACLDEALYATLTDPEFLDAAAQARRPLDVARGEDAAASIATAEESLPDLRVIVQENE